MKIKTIISADNEELKNINTACSVLQELEHLYDEHGEVEKRNAMIVALDVLLDIVNDEQ